MKSAFAIALFALALLVGCGTEGDEEKPACEAKLVNDVYACFDMPRYDGDNASLLKRGEPLQGCSDLLDTLPEGAYWWAKTDSTGEGVYGRVFVGENSWMLDGPEYGNGGFCVLDSIGADSAVAGKCITFVHLMFFHCYITPHDSNDGDSRLDGNNCDYHLMSCGQEMCAFVFPRDPARHLEEIEGWDCLGSQVTRERVADSLALDSTAVAVTMNDSIIEIKVLDRKMTWTKRPGL